MLIWEDKEIDRIKETENGGNNLEERGKILNRVVSDGLIEKRPKGDEGFSSANYWYRAIQAEETASGNVINWKYSRFEACLRNSKATNVAKAK